MTTDGVEPQARPRRPQRTPAARASRFAVAGGAVGLAFGLVGAMAGAAAHDAQAAVTPVHRVVVVPTPEASSTQLVVMLPRQVDTPVTTVEVPATGGSITIPERAAAPAPAARVAEPVAESGGS